VLVRSRPVPPRLEFETPWLRRQTFAPDFPVLESRTARPAHDLARSNDAMDFRNVGGNGSDLQRDQAIEGMRGFGTRGEIRAGRAVRFENDAGRRGVNVGNGHPRLLRIGGRGAGGNRTLSGRRTRRYRRHTAGTARLRTSAMRPAAGRRCRPQSWRTGRHGSGPDGHGSAEQQHGECETLESGHVGSPTRAPGLPSTVVRGRRAVNGRSNFGACLAAPPSRLEIHDGLPSAVAHVTKPGKKDVGKPP